MGLGSAVLSASRTSLLLLRLVLPRFRERLASVVGPDSPSPLGLHFAALRALLDPRLFPTCFLVRSSEWLPQVPPVAPGRSASLAPLVAVERPEHSPMDFLGALGRDCTAESDPAPRPLPPACPAASVPVAPPASADQIRRRFEDQQRELAWRAGRSLSVRLAVAHRQLATISRRAAAMIVTVRPVRRCLLVRLVAWRREADPVTAVRIVIVRPLTVHLASGRLLARRLGIGPQLHVRPLLQSTNGSTPLIAGTVFLAASVSRAHLARSRLCAQAQVGVRVVGDGEVTVAAEKRVQRCPQWSDVFWIGLMTWRRSFVARVRGRRHHQLLTLLPSSLSPRSCPTIPLDPRRVQSGRCMRGWAS
ncbi:unnamed protein product [Closterium sp. NIES-65]|nr:unnamed protein product [Closterium sp. NIES-65]